MGDPPWDFLHKLEEVAVAMAFLRANAICFLPFAVGTAEGEGFYLFFFFIEQTVLYYPFIKISSFPLFSDKLLRTS